MPNPLTGPQYLQQGISLVLKPGLRGFVILPLLVNLVLFAALITLAVQQFSLLLDQLLSSMPSWLGFLEFLIWPVFALLLVLTMFFTFTMLTSIIAAPFNGFLAEKVEAVVRGYDSAPPFKWSELFAMIPRTMAREFRKLAYFAPRALALLVLSFIPVVNILATPLWVLFGVWMMAIQFADYPADNNKLSWQDMLKWLRQKRLSSLGFGGVVYLGLMIPFLNLVLMPAAVAGATVFWVHEGPNTDQRQHIAP